MEQGEVKSGNVIKYKHLGLLIIVFIAGVFADQIVKNIINSEITEFFTISLIGFLLSIILGSAPIVLAIAAIMLGRFSEQSMIQRSDESIRLQNEVFVKTVEALQRIEASTGATEKRVEDIISGRAGALSHKLAEIATANRGRFVDTRLFEEQIKASILREIGGREESKQKRRKMEELIQRQKEFRNFHSKVLTGLSNINGVISKN